MPFVGTTPAGEAVDGLLTGLQVGQNLALNKRRQGLAEKEQAELANFRAQKLEMEKAAAARQAQSHAQSLAASKQGMELGALRVEDAKLGLGETKRQLGQAEADRDVDDSMSWGLVGEAGDSWRKRAGKDPMLRETADALSEFVANVATRNPDGVRHLAEQIPVLENQFAAKVHERNVADALTDLQGMTNSEWANPESLATIGEMLQSPDPNVQAAGVREQNEYASALVEKAGTEIVRNVTVDRLTNSLAEIDARAKMGQYTYVDAKKEAAFADLLATVQLRGSLSRDDLFDIQLQARKIANDPGPQHAEDDRQFSRSLALMKAETDRIRAERSGASTTVTTEAKGVKTTTRTPGASTPVTVPGAPAQTAEQIKAKVKADGGTYEDYLKALDAAGIKHK